MTRNGGGSGVPRADRARPGTHLCALYSSPVERDRLLFPFLRAGMSEGAKCLCLIDELDPTAVRARAVGDAAAGHPAPDEQLEVDRASDVYLKSGRFSVEHMIAVLCDTLAAMDGIFPELRAAGEMSWVLPKPPGADDFFAYESALNRIAAEEPAVFMCLYDLRRCAVSMLVDVLKTHPTVLVDRMVLYNPHYVSPQEYVAGAEPSPAVESLPVTAAGVVSLSRVQRATELVPDDDADLWQSLTPTELRVAALVADGMTNRGIAERMFVSPHTIDAHLKHIYVKVNIHSRVELAVLTLQHRTLA
jgi:DNA-binding CsgD family transcriptional regulator